MSTGKATTDKSPTERMREKADYGNPQRPTPMEKIFSDQPGSLGHFFYSLVRTFGAPRRPRKHKSASPPKRNSRRFVKSSKIAKKK